MPLWPLRNPPSTLNPTHPVAKHFDIQGWCGTKFFCVFSQHKPIKLFSWQIVLNEKMTLSMFFPTSFITAIYGYMFLKTKKASTDLHCQLCSFKSFIMCGSMCGRTSRTANDSTQPSICCVQCIGEPVTSAEGPPPCITSNQTSHGRNYMVLAVEFGCGYSMFVTTHYYKLQGE